jgi:mRNA interferase RelE/StbE
VDDYEVELKPTARKELDRLPTEIVERVVPKLEALAKNPRPHGCKKLKGGTMQWRLRVGLYRIVHTIDDTRKIGGVTRIRHRSEVYE